MGNKLSCCGLPSKTIQKIHDVFKSYPEIKQVCIYGSRAKGNYHPGSDIDLVIMDDLIKDSRLNELEIDLDDLLLPYKLDLTVFRKIQNQDLIDHINRVGILLYQIYLKTKRLDYRKQWYITTKFYKSGCLGSAVIHGVDSSELLSEINYLFC